VSRLETRDLEILRTLARLARLHFVPSAQLKATFFRSGTVGFRRIRAREGLDLIRRHASGAQPRTKYCAWRLTAQGMDAVRDEFESESVPEGMDERLAELSLIDLEDRDGWQSVQLWIAGVRHRADQFRWLADGAVILRFRDLGQQVRLVPDATMESVSKPVRLFVELDRSNKPLSRIEENLEWYVTFVSGHYRSHFGDGKVPSVV
jgi:hypothetical protein